MTIRNFDLIIIGAGPAGMAAAKCASQKGAKVALLDEQATVGGQIYRNVLNATNEQRKILGTDFNDGLILAQNLTNPNISHYTNTTVWDVRTNGMVTYSKNGIATQIQGKYILLATGACERSVPLPGWTLPGVMTAGAAQILLKTSGLIAKNAILVGSGPLLLLIAAQMLAAGYPPKAMVETQSLKDLLSASIHLPKALLGWRQLAKGINLIVKLKRAKIPRYTAAKNISITGTNAAKEVSFTSKQKNYKIKTDTILLHQGIVPNTQISRSLQLDHHYNTQQRCFHPVVDRFGQTSEPRISIAGDGAEINGAKTAILSGQISALNILVLLGRIDLKSRDKRCQPLLRARSFETSPRPFLDCAYPVPNSILYPKDDIIICRCEEVTVRHIRKAITIGAKGPNQVKIFTRAGMGSCQGRFCNLSITEILAHETNQTQDEIGSYRIRSPLKPVTLGELANLKSTNT